DSFEDGFPPRNTYDTRIPADPLDEKLAGTSSTPMGKTLSTKRLLMVVPDIY
ncbi:6289_t:CDS:1, partial [Paraglomus occultum]